MRISLRLYIGLAILAAALVAIGVLASRVGDAPEAVTSPEQTAEPAEPAVDLIAYVSLDSHVHTIRPDGFDSRQVSPPEGIYTWPTWAPNAERMVFSGVVQEEANGFRISLLAYDVASDLSHEIYVDEPGIAGFLAAGVVHYPLWAPDSNRLAFVAVTSSGLTLFLDDLGQSPEADPVLGDGPLWMSWSADARYLLVHRRGDHFLINTQNGIQAKLIDVFALDYRVPAWNPNQTAVTVAEETGLNEYTVYEAKVAGDGIDVLEPITSTTAGPAFLWSPNGEYLAVAENSYSLFLQNSPLFVYQNLTLVPQDKTRANLKINENILAYFWSPDSTKLAYVSITETQTAMRWAILDVVSGEHWQLVEFVPTLDQLTVFQFFDQYAYSHSLWSPSSDALVFAGTVSGTAVSASSGAVAQGPHIIVIQAHVAGSPLRIADGRLAFWSPQ